MNVAGCRDDVRASCSNGMEVGALSAFAKYESEACGCSDE